MHQDCNTLIKNKTWFIRISLKHLESSKCMYAAHARDAGKRKVPAFNLGENSQLSLFHLESYSHGEIKTVSGNKIHLPFFPSIPATNDNCWNTGMSFSHEWMHTRHEKRGKFEMEKKCWEIVIGNKIYIV